MLFTLFVAALAAMFWALGSFLLVGTSTHDPSSLELALMAAITLGTYFWMQWLRESRARAETLSEQHSPGSSPPIFAEADELPAAESLHRADHAA